jgi:hypothetical protein
MAGVGNGAENAISTAAGGSMPRFGTTWRALSPSVRNLALVLGGVQLILILAHLVAHLLSQSVADPVEARRLFDFNHEDSIQTVWSSGIMLAAGLAGLEAADLGGRRGRSLAWLALGLGFLWLGAEEVVGLHESLQVSNGTDWPILYLPALGLGVWVILRCVGEMEPRFRGLLIAGLIALGLAVGAEMLSSRSIAIDFQLRNLVEENLELGGAVLVMIAALAHGRPAPEPAESESRSTP